jgi:hypothetical protein
MIDDKRSLWLKYSLSYDKMVDSVQPHIKTFPPCQSKIEWDGTRYCVFSSADISAGGIIEEAPALVSHTTLEDVTKEGSEDVILSSLCIKYPTVHEVFNELGHPLVIPVGNFFSYRQSNTGNAEYIFNRTFNVVTIRALHEIAVGVEIVLRSSDVQIPLEIETKGCKGCGCNKTKRSAAKSKLKSIEESKPKSIVEAGVNTMSLEEALAYRDAKLERSKSIEEPKPNPTEKPKIIFKSMVNTGDLEAIKIKKVD